MVFNSFLVFCLFGLLGVQGMSSTNYTVDTSTRAFPSKLKFGAATAAYQIEGSWNVSGKAEGTWEHALHDVNPCINTECSNGDTACKSYELYARDVEMVKELGLDFYRFSISWPRILNYSFPNYTNPEGIAYYNNLIDLLLENNITPLVTIYHWDLPQTLEAMGGFTNPNIVDWLGDFARVCYENFGDRVKHWITINEPKEICFNGYGGGGFAPLMNLTGQADYLCSKNLLLAHANMYHIYNKEYRETQQGTIGIVLSARWYEPETSDQADVAERARLFEYGMFANPIFTPEGDWPLVVKSAIENNSKNEGFYRSRLPSFTEAEVAIVRGTSDFFGLNHYTSSMVYNNASTTGFDIPSFDNDVNVTDYQPASWQQNSNSWVYSVPWGFYNLLSEIRNKYSNPPIFVTENGYAIKLAVGSSDLDDTDRVAYHRDYISAMLDAIEQGADVQYYAVWSLMDNFSWKRGYKTRFGLYEVDMTDSNRTRTARASGYVFKNMLSTGYLNYSYVPDLTVDITES